MSRSDRSSRKRGATAFVLAGLALAMVGAVFATEPLYNAVRAAAGSSSTGQRTAVAPGAADTATRITVRFDANVNAALPWRFRPLQTAMKVRPGEASVAYYEATNVSDKPWVGTAVFNVTPLKVGAYFNNTKCFCSAPQVLRPGESARLPVTFFLDPKMVDDVYTSDVKTVTLSYTFYPAEDQSAAQDTASDQRVRATVHGGGNG